MNESAIVYGSLLAVTLFGFATGITLMILAFRSWINLDSPPPAGQTCGAPPPD